MTNILIDNGQVLVEIDQQRGRLVRFEHRPLAIRLVQEPRLAENFRLMLPLPYLRAHYIYGKDQLLSDTQVSERSCVLTWSGLQSEHGYFDIQVEQTIILDGDDVTFSLKVINNSPYIVEEVFNVAVGGMANFTERSDWNLHLANWGGQGAEWPFFDAFPGSYLGPAHPVWTAMYHKELSMPWVSLYNAKTRRGVYIGNHDRELRHSLVYAQLFPSTVYRHKGGFGIGIENNPAQGWPDPVVAGDTPIGLE